MSSRKSKLPATKADLDEATRCTKATLRSEMAGMTTALKSEMQGMKTELRSEMQDMKTELRSEMQDMKTELKGDIKRVAIEVVKNSECMDRFEVSLRKEMTRNTKRILEAIDAFVKKAEASEHRLAVIHRSLLSRYPDLLKKYGTYLTGLEASA